MTSRDWTADNAVAAAPLHSFQGTVWRVHWREVAPVDWTLSLRTSGRYHRGLDLFPPDQAFAAFYTSLAPEVATWEMVRRSAARTLAYLANNVLSELTVALSRVLDLSDPAAVGIEIAELTGSDSEPCRDIAVAALVRGCDALLVPSAAVSGLNLVILPANLAETVPIRVLGSRHLPIELLGSEQLDEGAMDR